MKHFKGMGLAIPFLLFLVWKLLSLAGLWSSYLLPDPSTVWRATIDLMASGVLWKHIAVSFSRVIGGFIVAALFAIPLGVLLGLRPALHLWLGPTLNFLRHTPPLALIPILILWLGIGEITKLTIIVLASFFPIFLNTENGVRETDIRLLEVGKSLGYSHKKIIRRIILPGSLPSIATGMRLGMGYSWRALIGAEMIAASSGLGYLILDAEQMSRSDVVFVGIFAIGLLGTLVDLVGQKIYRIWLPWSEEVSHGKNDSDSSSF